MKNNILHSNFDYMQLLYTFETIIGEQIINNTMSKRRKLEYFSYIPFSLLEFQ